MSPAGLLIACLLCALCLVFRLLQIAPAARSLCRSYPTIGAGNSALYAAAHALLKVGILHNVHFA